MEPEFLSWQPVCLYHYEGVADGEGASIDEFFLYRLEGVWCHVRWGFQNSIYLGA